MGRSVSYANGSILKVYYDISNFGYQDEETGFDEYEAQFEFEDFIYNLKEDLKKKYKSLSDCNIWIGREDQAILENRFTYFGISEYCGLVCLWVVLKDNLDKYYNDYDLNSLALKWVRSIEKDFYKSFGDLNKVGTFSNGEAVFTKIEVV